MEEIKNKELGTIDVQKMIAEGIQKALIEVEEKKIRSKQKKQRPPRYLSTSEAHKLFSTITNSKDKAITALMYYAGLRVSEANDMQKKHIDLEEKQIRVIYGKGGKSRNIPITEELLPIITDYVKTKNPEDYLFNTTVRTVQNHFKKNLEKAGLSPDFHCHSLRHSFACRLVEKNVSLEEIRRNLGHAHLNTTGIYLDASTEQRRKSMNKVKWT